MWDSWNIYTQIENIVFSVQSPPVCSWSGAVSRHQILCVCSFSLFRCFCADINWLTAVLSAVAMLLLWSFSAGRWLPVCLSLLLSLPSLSARLSLHRLFKHLKGKFTLLKVSFDKVWPRACLLICVYWSGNSSGFGEFSF